MGRSADYSKQNCALAATLDIVGEPWPWTLLIIRDAFKGIARFEQWQDSLGMARNVLAARLKHLVAHGIFEMRIYCDRPRRHEYLLTDKGHELRPVLLHMLDWGTRNVYGEEVPATGLIHTSCGHELHPVSHCAHCQERLQRGDVTEKLNPDAPSIGELYERTPEGAES
jgi:DNA-binding HxlR family transcriptional regulator